MLHDRSTAPAAADVDDVVDVLEVLANGARYDTAEGLYPEDCPEFARAGIVQT